MRLSVSQVARFAGGTVVGEENLVVTGAEVDSRLVKDGYLFVALQGAKTDGHRFVSEALGKCTAALVRSSWDGEIPGDRAVVKVEDTLKGYHLLAKRALAASGMDVAAVTGSVGKTTTKELLAAILKRAFGDVASSFGNRNSTLGLPAQILSAPEGTRLFVAEAGMSWPGELLILSWILKPRLVLFTEIAPVHTEFFDGLSEIAKAKFELCWHAKADATVVINRDDPYQVEMARTLPADFKLVAYCTRGSGDADAVLEDAKVLELGRTAVRIQLGGEVLETELRLTGLHQARNFLAAASAAWALGAPLEDISAAASCVEPLPGRGTAIKTASGITVLDESYNSSPRAVAAALETVKAAPVDGRRVAVLGTMAELGASSMRHHLEVGKLAGRVCDLLVAVGGKEAEAIAQGAREVGCADVVFVPDALSARELLEAKLEEGDTVLVKGSRVVGLETVVQGLVGGT